MIIVNFVETVYPMPAADEGDYCPDGEGSVYETGLSFRELVGYMRGYSQVSCYPATGATSEWLSAPSEEDWDTGEIKECSLHYHPKNPSRYAKYWRLAMRAAGIKLTQQC